MKDCSTITIVTDLLIGSVVEFDLDVSVKYGAIPSRFENTLNFSLIMLKFIQTAKPEILPNTLIL